MKQSLVYLFIIAFAAVTTAAPLPEEQLDSRGIMEKVVTRFLAPDQNRAYANPYQEEIDRADRWAILGAPNPYLAEIDRANRWTNLARRSPESV